MAYDFKIDHERQLIDDRDVRELVSFIDDHGRGLTAWEEDFLTSVADEDELTGKQFGVLIKIYDQRVP